MTTALDITRLMNNVRVHTAGAIESNIQLEIFNVVDEFFRETNAWQEDIDITLVASEGTYQVSPSDGTIVRLISLLNSSSIPVPATMFTPGTIVLNTVPNTVETLTAKLAVTVIDPVTTAGYPICLDDLFNRYLLALIDGVVGRMQSQAAKPYTNERMAIFHTRRFRAAMSRVRFEVLHTNLYGAQAWRFPAFASGSQR